MKVRNHKLVYASGKSVPFDASPNKSSSGLSGGKPKYVIIHYLTMRPTKHQRILFWAMMGPLRKWVS